MDGKAHFLFLLICLEPKQASGSRDGAGTGAQRPLLIGLFDLHAQPLVAHFLPTWHHNQQNKQTPGIATQDYFSSTLSLSQSLYLCAPHIYQPKLPKKKL